MEKRRTRKRKRGGRTAWQKDGRLLLPAFVMLLLSGCLFRPPDDLYRLPEMSAGYDQLNETIRAVRSSLEAEYGVSTDVATIVSGDNTATIQLQDLDGDGERESAVTFLQVPGVEKSLKIYIFRQVGEDYQVAGVVEGDGSAIYAVDYIDLNGSGTKELVVSWQISAGVYQLGAYTLDELSSPERQQQLRAGRVSAGGVYPGRAGRPRAPAAAQPSAPPPGQVGGAGLAPGRRAAADRAAAAPWREGPTPAAIVCWTSTRIPAPRWLWSGWMPLPSAARWSCTAGATAGWRA